MAKTKSLGLSNQNYTPYYMNYMQGSTGAQYVNPARAQHTTAGGFGGLGTPSNGGYSYSSPYSGPQGLTGSNTGLYRLKNQGMALFNPTGDSGQNFIGTDGVGALDSNGNAVNLNYEQLDAINNPTQGAEGIPDSAGGGMAGYAGLTNSAVGAFTAYNQYKMGKENLKMAREKFGFEKAATNRGLQNQASEYNTALDNRHAVGLALGGGAMSQAQIDASNADNASRRLSTTAIG